MILETERIILRELTEDDAEFMLDLLNQPSFIKYIGDRFVRNLSQSREFIENRYRVSYAEHGFGLYAVELKAENSNLEPEILNLKSEIRNQTVGICGFVKRDYLPDADLGFAFLPQFEKKGLAFESADAVMKYGREKLDLKKILAITTQDNESSGRLLERLGFAFEGLVKLPHDPQMLKLFTSE